LLLCLYFISDMPVNFHSWTSCHHHCFHKRQKWQIFFSWHGTAIVSPPPTKPAERPFATSALVALVRSKKFLCRAVVYDDDEPLLSPANLFFMLRKRARKRGKEEAWLALEPLYTRMTTAFLAGVSGHQSSCSSSSSPSSFSFLVLKEK